MTALKTDKKNNSPRLSYWELKTYFTPYDLIVIGSGIVGLNAAIAYKNANKKARVLVLEKGVLPSGASTKNAGFSCFGSVSELTADLEKMPEQVVWDTLKMRWDGLKLLRNTVGDKNMDYRQLGGYEVFENRKTFEACADRVSGLNKELYRIIGKKNAYSDATRKLKKFGLAGFEAMLVNKYEGQIDTALMMERLTGLAHEQGVKILNGVRVEKLSEGSPVEIESDLGSLRASKVIVAINGFAKQLLKLRDVSPARAQVLITGRIDNLKLKGTFHYDEGYYYFRNIDGRVLLGGGRNLDLAGETTEEIALTDPIQNKLEQMLRTMILPGRKFSVEHRWAGIMGVGNEKKPIIRNYSKNIVCAVRMGGMGIAIGSLVGKEAAALVQG